MKSFTKRAALVVGLLFTALLCMGIVFIDSTANFWKMESGIVKLYVSNTIPVMMVDTNTQRIGIFSTNTSFAFEVLPRRPSTNSAATGQSSAIVGGINLQGAVGGNTVRLTTGTGGAGGGIFAQGGDGGDASLATTNATGGAGGGLTYGGGTGGGAVNTSATNASTGGSGGPVSFSSGAGGSPAAQATNTVGGNGGTFTFTGGSGGTPTAGWARKGGGGSTINLNAGNGGDGVRTNAGNGGSFNLTAGNGGAATTTPAFPGLAGGINIIAGNGGTGDTNAFGGNVSVAGGTGAADGNVLLGVASGAPRGNVGVGTNNPQAKLHVAGDVAMTTAGQPVHLGAASTNNVRQTNWIGTILVLAGATIEADFNLFSEIIQTNRMAGNEQIDLNNASAGYRRMRGAVPGEAAGGTDRTLTFSAPSGQLIIDLDDFSAVPALTKVITVTNGNVVVWDDEIQLLNGTNCHAIVTRQAKF